MSPDHRRVIRLARIKKMPIQEIAREMDRTPGAISQLLLRALDQLKQRFGDTQSLRLPPCRLDESEDGGRDDSER